jgi:hypothetical protein
MFCEILGFYHGVVEGLCSLGCHVAWVGIWLPSFWDNPLFQENCLTLEDGIGRLSWMSVTNYQPTPHDIPEARRPSYILLTTLFSNKMLWARCVSLTLSMYFLSFSVTLIGGVVFLLFSITALFFDPNAEWRMCLTCHLLKLSNIVKFHLVNGWSSISEYYGLCTVFARSPED